MKSVAEFSVSVRYYLFSVPSVAKPACRPAPDQLTVRVRAGRVECIAGRQWEVIAQTRQEPKSL